MKITLREHQLADFQRKLHKKAESCPVDPGISLWENRRKLIEEEFEELNDAVLLKEGKEQELKELCDLLYVVYGAVYERGLSSVIAPAFNRVHDNNMLKLEKGRS